MSLERCAQCVLPARTAPINKEGLCPFCAGGGKAPDWKKLEADFQKIVTSLKSRGGKYDCLVPLNGGKNSSFVFHYMRNVCKTNPLAFTWDNDLIREGAWKNIKTALSKTGTDHEIIRYDPNLWRTTLRATFREYERTCWCPIFVIASAIPVAVKHKIPAIITGFSEGYRQCTHNFSIPDKKQNMEEIKTFLKVWSKVFEEAISAHEDAATTAKILDHLFGPLAECLKNTEPEDFPVLVPLSNYVNWMDHEQLAQTLSENIGWVKPTDVFHSSCNIEPMKGYLEFLTGIDEIHSELSNIIRSGHMTRDQALKELELLNVHAKEPKEMQHFVDFLSIQPTEFHEIIAQGPKKIIFMQGVDGGKISPQDIMKSVAWLFQCQTHDADYAPKSA